MLNNHDKKIEGPAPKSPRPIDLAIHQSLMNIKENWAVFSRRKIATWKGLLIIVFLSGFASALFWAGYRDLYTGIFADEGQIQITNTASVTYEDATNTYGPVLATVSVTKTAAADITAPAQITNLTASIITSSSVTLTWTAPGNDGDVGLATSYDFRYSTKKINDKNDTDWNDAIQVTDEPAPQTAGLTENHTVSQLTPDSDYWFVMKTSDSFQESALSNVLPIKTITTGQTVKKIKISLPKNYDENVKVVVIDITTGNELEEVKTKTANQKIDINFKQELNYGQYYIMIIVPQSLSKKMAVDLDADDKDITVGESELPAGNLSDGDDVINAADWDIMRGKWGSSIDPEADLNQDGLVNTLDWSIMKKNWNARGACPQDATEAECRDRV